MKIMQTSYEIIKYVTEEYNETIFSSKRGTSYCPTSN